MKIKQTDYAFPFTYEDEKTLTVCSGMELRDYFAAKAMQSLIEDEHDCSDWLSKRAYEYADAMIKARKE